MIKKLIFALLVALTASEPLYYSSPYAAAFPAYASPAAYTSAVLGLVPAAVASANIEEAVVPANLVPSGPFAPAAFAPTAFATPGFVPAALAPSGVIPAAIAPGTGLAPLTSVSAYSYGSSYSIQDYIANSAVAPPPVAYSLPYTAYADYFYKR